MKPAAAAVNGLCFSLGNEPDLYELPNYAALDKPFPVKKRAAAALYMQLAAYLTPALGSEPLVGPELAPPPVGGPQLPRVVRACRLGTVGVHLYPLTTCRSATRSDDQRASSPPRRGRPGPSRVGRRRRAAAGRCRRSSPRPTRPPAADARGVSNTPAAAVWAVRFVLSALEGRLRRGALPPQWQLV